ncbi:MAG: TlpA family protein disulfide reductase [Chloroflexaceae bacterium]|nr:TlpA family protein disulfide reductase [Chloroflexaceae bacterium]
MVRMVKVGRSPVGVVGSLVVLLLLVGACGDEVMNPADPAGSNSMAGPAPVWPATAVPSGVAEANGGAGTAGEGEQLVALESALIDREPGQLTRGGLAPDFSYTLADGTTHTLSEHRGRRVMINFWATWCPPCKAEMPDIQKAFEQFRDDGFVVLAVSQDPETRVIEPFVLNHSLTFPVIADPSSEIAQRYGARALPSSYFINTDGTLFAKVLGW